MTNEITETPINATDDLYEAVDELVDVVESDELGNLRFNSREEAQLVAAKLIRVWTETLNISEFAVKQGRE